MKTIITILLLCSSAVGGFVAGSRYERSSQSHLISRSLPLNGEYSGPGVLCSSDGETTIILPKAGAHSEPTRKRATEKPKKSPFDYEQGLTVVTR